MATIINASTSAGLIQTADTSGTLQLQSNGVTQQTVDSTGSYGQLKQGTVNAGGTNPFNNTLTSVPFTGIPSWVKRITVMFNGVSTSGTSAYIVQLGSGSTTTTGYNSSASNAGNAATSYTNSIPVTNGAVAASNYSGIMTITNITGNTWCGAGTIGGSGGVQGTGAGSIALSGVLDRVVITTNNGTDTFDAGSINILYEG